MLIFLCFLFFSFKCGLKKVKKKKHTNLLEALRDVKGLMQNTMTWGEEKNRGNTERVKKATSRCLAAATFPFSSIFLTFFSLVPAISDTQLESTLACAHPLNKLWTKTIRFTPVATLSLDKRKLLRRHWSQIKRSILIIQNFTRSL